MITGHNTDVEYHGRTYHVQTEDKGNNNPIIESLVYHKGHILASRRSSYAEVLKAGGGEKEILERLEAQHRRVMLEVRSGKYDPEGPPKFGEGFISSRSLDEVVLEYLRSIKTKERMEVIVQTPSSIVFGKSASLEIYVRTELTSKPVGAVDVTVRLSRSGHPEIDLYRGKTNDAGLAETTITIPDSQDASAVLIVEAVSADSRDETRMLVRRSQPAHAGEPQPAR